MLWSFLRASASDQRLRRWNGMRVFRASCQRNGSEAMSFNVVLIQPIIALIAGILILLVPRLLNYIVAIYLIVIGIAGLLPHG
jgi:hypothetical protein